MTKIDVAFLRLISVASNFLELYLKMLNTTHVSLSVFSVFLIKVEVEVKLSIFGVVCFKYHTRLVIKRAAFLKHYFQMAISKDSSKPKGFTTGSRPQ